MILTKTTCRVCGAYPVFVDDESGEIWDDQDATESHLHQSPSYVFEKPDDVDLHRADDEGMTYTPVTTREDAGYTSSDDSTDFGSSGSDFGGFGGGGDFGGGGGGSEW